MSQRRLRFRRVALLLLLCLTLLTGCWDNREPRRRAFVLGMAIDAGEEADVLEVSVQLPVPHAAKASGASGGGGGGAQEPQYLLVRGSGPTLSEALERVQDRVSRSLFLGQMRMILLSEQLSAQQVRAVVHGLRTETEIEETVYMAVTEGRADRVMEFEPPLERLPALYFNTVFEATRRSTITIPIQYWEFARALETSGWEPILPLVRLTETQELEVRGLGVFRGHELRGFLEGDAVEGYLWLVGQVSKRALSIPTEEGYVGIRSMAGSRTVSVRFEDDEPVFTVHMLINGEVGQAPPGVDDDLVLNQAGPLAEAVIRRQVGEAISLIQEELRTDIFGFGKRLFYMYPRYFEGVDWEERFPEVRIESEIKLRLLRKGAES
ncbi:MAG: Ger(x)C family spore germination protein [Bacillota bacterium]